MDIEVIQKSLSSRIIMSLHFGKEPWEEIDVIVGRIVGEANCTSPVFPETQLQKRGNRNNKILTVPPRAC